MLVICRSVFRNLSRGRPENPQKTVYACTDSGVWFSLTVSTEKMLKAREGSWFQIRVFDFRGAGV